MTSRLSLPVLCSHGKRVASLPKEPLSEAWAKGPGSQAGRVPDRSDCKRGSAEDPNRYRILDFPKALGAVTHFLGYSKCSKGSKAPGGVLIPSFDFYSCSSQPVALVFTTMASYPELWESAVKTAASLSQRRSYKTKPFGCRKESRWAPAGQMLGASPGALYLQKAAPPLQSVQRG